MAHQVFISYASADAVVAERVCAALESRGISCWIAPRDIGPGTDYPAAIVDAVAACRVMVLILTGNAVASPHIVTEVGHAFNAKKRIVPFRLAPVALSKDLDYFLSMAQWLDARDGCTDQNLKLLGDAAAAAIRGEARLGEARPGEGASAGLARSMKLRLITGLAVIAAGIILVWKWPHPAQPIPEAPRTESHASGPVTAAPTGPAPADAARTTPTADAAKILPGNASPGKTWLNPKDGQVYAWIPPGTFTMGCSAGDSQCADDEKPSHPVEIPKGFWLARTEATVAAYRKFATRHGLELPPGDGNFPMTNLTWAEAKAYCHDIGGRLPSEAEWEYAARGGKAEAYYGVVPAIAWYAGNSGGVVHAVGGKKPNQFGLYDMLGNVSEWVLDRYYNRYDLSSPATGAGIDQPLAANASAVARGGFWDGGVESVRASHRAPRSPDDAEPIVGVRCALDRSEKPGP